MPSGFHIPFDMAVKAVAGVGGGQRECEVGPKRWVRVIVCAKQA